METDRHQDHVDPFKGFLKWCAGGLCSNEAACCMPIQISKIVSIFNSFVDKNNVLTIYDIFNSNIYVYVYVIQMFKQIQLKRKTV